MFVAVLSSVANSMVHLYSTVLSSVWIVAIFSSDDVGRCHRTCATNCAKGYRYGGGQFVDLINEMSKRRRETPHATPQAQRPGLYGSGQTRPP